MERNNQFDRLRGVAALVVVLEHWFKVTSANAYFNTESEFHWFWSTPISIICEGSSAVMVFFALSGYLFAEKALNDSRQSILLRISIHGYNRFVRLYVPTLMSLCATYLLYNLSGFDIEQIQRSYGGGFSSLYFPGSMEIVDVPNIVIFNLILGESPYNPALWTIQPEFIVVWFLFIATTVSAVVQGIVTVSLVNLLALSIAFILVPSPLIMAFFSGALMFRCRDFVNNFSLFGEYKISVLVVCLFLLSINERTSGWFLQYLQHYELLLFIIAKIIPAGVVVGILSGHREQGERNVWLLDYLGKYSFEIYLLHIPVMLSVLFILSAKVNLSLSALFIIYVFTLAFIATGFKPISEVYKVFQLKGRGQVR